MEPTLALIREFEGYRDTPYWDVNAYRTGYGSDTITMADGSVRSVSQGMTINRDDAERDLVRRVSTEFAPGVARSVGSDVWGKLSEPQRAALTSIAYNYGSVPGSVVQAVRSGDMRAATAAITGLGSHNDGVNKKRREREAAIFSGGAQLASSAPQTNALAMPTPTDPPANALAKPERAPLLDPNAFRREPNRLAVQPIVYERRM